MRRFLALAPTVVLALVLSGCCGGYAVVRTTVADHAQLKDKSEIVQSPQSAVLHYSRLGEPTNGCGADVKYLENLWLQVPSLTPGQAYMVGGPGVVVAYTRLQGEQTIQAASITGKVTIKGQEADGLSVDLEVTITLPSGEAVKLDDDYSFHPMTPEKAGPGGPEQARVWSACRASL